MRDNRWAVIQEIHHFYAQMGGFLCLPATVEQIVFTENYLGFALPDSLRSYYLEVANGGFGPPWGIPGVHGGYIGTTGDIGEALGNLFDCDITPWEETLIRGQLITLQMHHTHFNALTHLALVDRGCGSFDDMNIQTGRIYRTEVATEKALSLQLVAEDLDTYLVNWLTEVDKNYEMHYATMRNLHLQG